MTDRGPLPMLGRATFSQLENRWEKEGMRRSNDDKEKRSGSVADGFKKLAVATMVFRIAYVLFPLILLVQQLTYR